MVHVKLIPKMKVTLYECGFNFFLLKSKTLKAKKFEKPLTRQRTKHVNSEVFLGSSLPTVNFIIMNNRRRMYCNHTLHVISTLFFYSENLPLPHRHLKMKVNQTMIRETRIQDYLQLGILKPDSRKLTIMMITETRK